MSMKKTRRAQLTNHTIESILDFFIDCDQILPLVSKMMIDENGMYALTKYRKNQIVKTDHNILKLELNLNFQNDKIIERVEVFNLRNKLCQEDSKEKTTNTDKFTSCFEGDETVDVQFKRWHRRLLKTLHSCFRKVRVKNIEDTKKIKS